MNRKLFFIVAILVFLLLGCNYSNSENKNTYDYDEIDKKTEIDNQKQEIVNTQALEDDKSILKDSSECKVEKEHTAKTTNAVVSNNNNGIKKSDNKKLTNIKVKTKNNKQEIRKKDAEVKMGAIAPIKEPSISMEIKEDPEEIKPIPEEIEAKIVKKYTILFENLRTEYEGKINKLLEQAKGEYLTLSDDERSKQKLKLGFKYLKLGRSLEGECDKRFYSILEQMKSELKANDIESNAANEAEKLYKSEKSERQKSLLKKAFEK